MQGVYGTYKLVDEQVRPKVQSIQRMVKNMYSGDAPLEACLGELENGAQDEGDDDISSRSEDVD